MSNTIPIQLVVNEAVRFLRLRGIRDYELESPSLLRIRGHAVDLENLHRSVIGSSQPLALVVHCYLEAALPVFDFSPESWHEAESIILPRIHSERLFEKFARERIPHIPLVTGLNMLFVLDFPQSTVSVNTSRLEQWSATLALLEAQALENLDRLPDPSFERVTICRGIDCLAINNQDGYDTSRLLSRRVREILQQKHGGDFLALIPTRDICLTFPRRVQEALRRKEAAIEKTYQDAPYPITNAPLLGTVDGLAWAQ